MNALRRKGGRGHGLVARAAVATDLETFGAIAEEWYAVKQALRAGSLGSMRSRLDRHLLPVLGPRPMVELDTRDALAVRVHVETHARPKRGHSSPAPATIRNVLRDLAAIWRWAQHTRRIGAALPCPVVPELFPPDVDADPRWREGAWFAQEERDRLLTDPRVAPELQAYLWVLALTGGRAGEGAVLWRDYDRSRSPLPSLTIVDAWHTQRGERRGTKTHVAKVVPIGPEGQAFLAKWRAEGWAKVFGRPPTEEDLIAPALGRRGRWAGKSRPWRSDVARAALHAACATLGLRPRSTHDLRRTWLVMARKAGVPAEVRWAVTHPPRRDVRARYDVVPYEDLCAGVARLPFPSPVGQLELFARPEPPVEMPAVPRQLDLF